MGLFCVSAACFASLVHTSAQTLEISAQPEDAAFVITLTLGTYTVVGSSATDDGTGVVFVEAYVVP